MDKSTDTREVGALERALGVLLRSGVIISAAVVAVWSLSGKEASAQNGFVRSNGLFAQYYVPPGPSGVSAPLSNGGRGLVRASQIAIGHKNDLGIEINGNPRRLELDWRWWGLARSLGVRAAINPDAHSPGGLDDVSFGLGVARKGGLGGEDVVNAWDRRRVQQYFAGRRRS